jgi:uncharacterized protein (TIRG00374 family)
MARKKSPIRQLLSPSRIFIPIGLGLLVAAWLLYTEFDLDSFSQLSWGWSTVFWIFMSLVMVATRDFGYMFRIRYLTDKAINWRNAFDVIMLWEFASAISPSVVGGSGVAIFIVNKEGIKLGKSTAVVMVTAFLDELFYILMVPLVFAFVAQSELFPAQAREYLGDSLSAEAIFYIGYGFIVLLTSIILSSIFFFPKGLRNLLAQIGSWRLFRRWESSFVETGDEIVTTSIELKGKPFKFWLTAFSATFFSWTARFWVVNCLIMALAPILLSEHMLVYARQLVMWVIMLISPTPGGAGIAEIAFKGFLASLIPLGLAGTLALLWRLFTYYPYLFLGAIILPRWIRKVYLKRPLIKFKSPS